MGLEEKHLTPETISALQQKYWPGNVRQLQNLCQQLCVMAPGEQILPEDLPSSLSETDPRSQVEGSWSESLRRWTQTALSRGQVDVMAKARTNLEKTIVDCALDYTGGKRVEAARLLGVGRNTLTRKLNEIEGR